MGKKGISKSLGAIAKFTLPGAIYGAVTAKPSPGPKLSQGAFDISQQAKQYEDLLAKQREQNLAASQELTTQLQQQARGEGPLAGAQLRAAQNRNLAQTLSAAQTAGASPLAARQMLQTRAQQSRDLAELGQQERLQAQQALAQQIAQQSGMSRADITTGFGIAKAPQELMADYEKARFAADVARRNAVQQQQSQMLGGILSAGAQLGAAALSDEEQKKNIKPASKEVNSFLDKLSAREYEYKDASLPGTAEGRRVGIMAQDLEKSTLGKTLVKQTENGKMVDTVQGFGAVLAAQAELNRRLKKIEKKGK